VFLAKNKLKELHSVALMERFMPINIFWRV